MTSDASQIILISQSLFYLLTWDVSGGKCYRFTIEGVSRCATTAGLSFCYLGKQ